MEPDWEMEPNWELIGRIGKPSEYFQLDRLNNYTTTQFRAKVKLH
jgi:hypothetical protein